jgi:hypothetical protein
MATAGDDAELHVDVRQFPSLFSLCHASRFFADRAGREPHSRLPAEVVDLRAARSAVFYVITNSVPIDIAVTTA